MSEVARYVVTMVVTAPANASVSMDALSSAAVSAFTPYHPFIVQAVDVESTAAFPVLLTREQIETLQTGLSMWRHDRDTGDDWSDVEEIDRILEAALTEQSR